MNLKGKIAIVTGAGSERGIGRSIALKLADYGCNVVVADMNLEGAKKVAAEIEAKGCKALAVENNVTNEASVVELMKKTEEAFGRLDILVNNAGITQPVTTLNTTVDDWNRVIAVNLTGTFLCSREAVRIMQKNKYGRIVNISSVSGKRGGGVYGGVPLFCSQSRNSGFFQSLCP